MFFSEDASLLPSQRLYLSWIIVCYNGYNVIHFVNGRYKRHNGYNDVFLRMRRYNYNEVDNNKCIIRGCFYKMGTVQNIDVQYTLRQTSIGKGLQE